VLSQSPEFLQQGTVEAVITASDHLRVNSSLLVWRICLGTNLFSCLLPSVENIYWELRSQVITGLIKIKRSAVAHFNGVLTRALNLLRQHFG